MAEQDFRVVREHEGDRFYKEGEIRTADPKAVEHLVPHVLDPITAPVKKAAPEKKPAASKKAPAPRKRKGK